MAEGKKKDGDINESDKSFADQSTRDQSGISGFFSSMFSVCGTERGGMCTTKPKAPEQPIEQGPPPAKELDPCIRQAVPSACRKKHIPLQSTRAEKRFSKVVENQTSV